MKIVHDFSKVISFLVRFTHGMRYAKSFVALVILMGLISGLSSAALIAVINSALGHRDLIQSQFIAAFAGLCALAALSRFFSSALLAYLNTRAGLKICTNLSGQILSAPLRRLEQIGPHRLLAALTGDINTISNILPALPGVIMNAALVTGSLIYLGWLSPLLLGGLIILMGVGICVYQILTGRARGLMHALRYKGDILVSYFRAIVEGTKELKLHSNRGEALLSKFLLPTATDMANLNYRGAVINSAAMSWGTLVSFIPIGLLFLVAPRFSTFAGGVLSGYVLTILYMTGPLQAVMAAIPSISFAGVSVDKLYSLNLFAEARPTAPGARPAGGGIEKGWTELSLSKVSHSYYSEEKECDFKLGPVDMVFHPGEIVFLTGGNGSGKTTLAKIISGLYTPDGGEIKIDGETISDESRDRYRQNFTMIFSDFFLFEGLLGLESPDLDEQAQRYLRELRLDNKVHVKDGQLSTTKLSQGQRKRLALLQAYLEDKPIYIFDEWASDQDPLFREIFYSQILPGLSARGKLVIVISHDDRYYNAGDRLIKLDYGKVEYDHPMNNSQWLDTSAHSKAIHV
jgi:putative ATP-binding cassette transporter